MKDHHVLILNVAVADHKIRSELLLEPLNLLIVPAAAPKTRGLKVGEKLVGDGPEGAQVLFIHGEGGYVDLSAEGSEILDLLVGGASGARVFMELEHADENLFHIST